MVLVFEMNTMGRAKRGARLLAVTRRKIHSTTPGVKTRGKVATGTCISKPFGLGSIKGGAPAAGTPQAALRTDGDVT